MENKILVELKTMGGDVFYRTFNNKASEVLKAPFRAFLKDSQKGVNTLVKLTKGTHWFNALNTVTEETPTKEIGDAVIINWACAWNERDDVGCKGVVMYAEDNWCILFYVSRARNSMTFGAYRMEDVSYDL